MKKLLITILLTLSLTQAAFAEPVVSGTCGWIKKIKNNITNDQSIKITLKDSGVFTEMEGYPFSKLYMPLAGKTKNVIRNTSENLIFAQFRLLEAAMLVNAPVCITQSIDGLKLKEVIGVGIYAYTIEEAHADAITKLNR